jgi:hypothetical protein
MTGWLSIALLAAAAVKPTVVPAGKLRAMDDVSPDAGGNFTLTVSPATITFSATNPGTLPVVAGSSTATTSWNARGSGGGNTWTLKVQAAATTFTNCSTVPVSAVTVTCSAANVTGGSGTHGATANCAAAFPLSTTAATVASGADANNTLSYSATITFTLADNWKYIAETSPACTLSLTYTANVP